MDPEPQTPDDRSRATSVRVDSGPVRFELVAPARALGDDTGRVQVVAATGWVVAALVVFAGGFLLWHLLFGAAVGGDVWLGRPLAETAGAGGTPVSVTAFPAGSPYVPHTTVSAHVVAVSVPPSSGTSDPATVSGPPGTEVDDATATAAATTTTAATTITPTTTTATTATATTTTTTTPDGRGAAAPGETAGPGTTVPRTSTTSTTVDDDSDDDSSDDDSSDDAGGNRGRGGGED